MDKIADDLKDLQIGAKLKHARKLKGLRLKELAEAVGCSESLLSKVENEKVKPSLRVLHSIVSKLDTTIGALFSNSGNSQERNIIMRSHERPIIRTHSLGRNEVAGVRLECLIPQPESRLLYGSIHVVEPGKGSDGYIEHQGEEVGYVLEGEFELTVDGTTYQLSTGDSFFFDSYLPHGYRNPGEITTRVLWVNTPSTF